MLPLLGESSVTHAEIGTYGCHIDLISSMYVCLHALSMNINAMSSTLSVDFFGTF